MRTTAEVAAELRLSPVTIQRHARRLGLGINAGGRAGYRFSDRDIERLRQSLRTQADPRRAAS